MFKFYVFEDIGLKLDKFMYYDFLINIVKNDFFKKMNISDLLTFYEIKFRLCYFLIQIYF